MGRCGCVAGGGPRRRPCHGPTWRRFSIPQCPWIQAATASGWASVMRREQTRVDHLDALPTFEGAGASDLEHLGSGGEAHPGGGLDGLDGAPHPPTVAGVDARDGWDALAGQGLESTVQGLLVAFDRQHVVATLIADPLGGVHLGVHRIGAHHRPVEVQGFEKLPERGDLVGLVRHPLLGQDRAGGVVQSGQEMRRRHLPLTSPAHGLAVHRNDCSSFDGAGACAQP